MKRYVIKFRQYGKEFYLTSPVLNDKKFAEVWGCSKAAKNHAFGWDFVQVEESKWEAA